MSKSHLHAAKLPVSRRKFLVLGAAIASPMVARSMAPAWAQDGFPARPIRLVIPWTAGSTADLQMRSLAQLAQASLGQPVIIENRPGAGGTLHAVQLATGKPDGYTLGQMHLGMIRRPFMLASPQWDPVTSFTHILRLCGWRLGFAVKADSPWKTMAEFIQTARDKPGQLTVANSGAASSPHIGMIELAEKAGIQINHVPFKSTAEGVNAVAGGHVDAVAGESSIIPLVEGGQLRALSAWSRDRFVRLPDVPTLRELGYDMEVTTGFGISGPKGMPQPLVRLLHDAFKKALFAPENKVVRDRFDMSEEYLDSDGYRAFIVQRAEYERQIVQKYGLKAE
jgi:tripartite-type tricarboxylate transporter receptor subunit TctC